MVFLLACRDEKGIDESATPLQVLTQISGEASDNINEVDQISETIFGKLEPVLEETYAVAEYIDSRNGKLSKEDRRKVLDRVKTIHLVMKDLSENRDYWKEQLQFSVKEASKITEGGDEYLQIHAEETRRLEKKLKSAKRSGKIPENRLNAMALAVSLSNQKTDLYRNLVTALKDFEENNLATGNQIEEFLEVISESALITRLMLELMEVEVHGDQIKENLKGLQELNTYMDNINLSLQKLGKSLMEMQRITSGMNN